MKRKSFWQALLEGFATIGEGLSHLFYFGASREMPPNCREILEKSNEQALREDWEKVGEDFNTVIKQKADN